MNFKGIALILSGFCILVFILQSIYPVSTNILLLNKNSLSEPWRFITAIFAHGNIGHLLYNILALALFGSILEKLIGSKKFTLIFFVTGIAANIFSINFYENSLGASGAIFGVIGALVIIRPGLTVWAFGLPMPMFVAGIFWAIGDVIGIFAPSGTANIAHLAGMLFGSLFGFIFRQKSVKVHREEIKLNEDTMRYWEDHYMR